MKEALTLLLSNFEAFDAGKLILLVKQPGEINVPYQKWYWCQVDIDHEMKYHSFEKRQ